MKVNIKKIKCLDKKSNLKRLRENSFVKSLLFPLFLSPLIVSCQSSMNQKSSDLYLTMESTSIASKGNKEVSPTQKIVENSNSLQKMNRLNEEVSKKETKQEVKSAKAAKSISSKKLTVYAPIAKTKSENDLELNMDDTSLLPEEAEDNSENLIFNGSDSALSAESPEEFESNSKMISSASPSDSLLLCEDNVYYDSWKEQFDRQWLVTPGQYVLSVRLKYCGVHHWKDLLTVQIQHLPFLHTGVILLYPDPTWYRIIWLYFW